MASKKQNKTIRIDSYYVNDIHGKKCMTNIQIKPELEESWLHALQNEFQQPYFHELRSFLRNEKNQYEIYPPGKQIFRALDHTPLHRVKVVIIGQDPYHGPGQANGMCFSVSPGVKHPPSLKNIFKELQTDLGMAIPESGDLTPWADQGVLLLNATLTVRRSEPGSHQKKGWELFTDAIIRTIDTQTDGVVFLLWGRFAQMKAGAISSGKHHLLKAAHPSPFSAHSGFFGCKHFSKANEWLQANGKATIDWDPDWPPHSYAPWQAIRTNEDILIIGTPIQHAIIVATPWRHGSNIIVISELL